MWACTLFFFFVMICIHLKCYIPTDYVHLIMRALCERKKRMKYFFFNVFSFFI
jgi:hypothetical protein